MSALKDPRVIIVGGGMAGLTTAEILFRDGFRNITILEAKDRVGGRIFSKSFGTGIGGYVEMGAQFLGGTTQTCSSYVLANEIGLKPNMESGFNWTSYTERVHIHTTDGRIIDAGLIKEVNKYVKNWFDENYYAKQGDERTLEELLTGFLNNKVLPEFTKEEEDDIRMYFNSIRLWIEVGEGIPVSECLIEEEDSGISGPEPQVLGPLSALVEEVANRFPSTFIKLNHPVTNINWESKNVAVTCAVQGENKTFQADHVVVTCPLGFLKKNHHTLFQPALTTEKVNAIKRIPFGATSKIFLEYEVPFWVEDSPSIMIARTDDDFKESEKKWLSKVLNISASISCKNVLLIWLGNVTQMMDDLSDEEVAEDLTGLLRSLTRNPSIPSPTRILKSSWSSDPYTLGVYSTRGKAMNADFDALTKSLMVDEIPRVLFAGEATNKRSLGYMHSARDSGFRVAEELVELYHSGLPIAKL